MSTDKEQKNTTKKEFSKKYVILTNQMMWQDPTTKFQLNWFNPEEEESWWARTEDIPGEAVDIVKKAIGMGILKVANSYKKRADKNKVAGSKGRRKDKLVWTELDKDDVKANKRTPRNPSIAKGTLTYGDQNSKAYQILQKTVIELTKELPKITASMSKENAEAFLREAMDIEKHGYNRVLHPRDSVLDTIKQILVSMGLSSGITRVVQERDDEPITRDSKPVRFAL